MILDLGCENNVAEWTGLEPATSDMGVTSRLSNKKLTN